MVQLQEVLEASNNMSIETAANHVMRNTELEPGKLYRMMSNRHFNPADTTTYDWRPVFVPFNSVVVFLGLSKVHHKSTGTTDISALFLDSTGRRLRTYSPHLELQPVET